MNYNVCKLHSDDNCVNGINVSLNSHVCQLIFDDNCVNGITMFHCIAMFVSSFLMTSV